MDKYSGNEYVSAGTENGNGGSIINNDSGHSNTESNPESGRSDSNRSNSNKERDTSDRYSRQEAFYGMGRAGQQKLLASRVAVIGLGALGSASANLLARAGIGFLRIVDRDYVEYSNLQRQILFREKDAADSTPKAAAAAEILREINSEIEIEPVICDVNSTNIDDLIGDVDLVIDATDNMEIRVLINEACHVLKKPWIFGGVLASYGMTMNILPDDDAPCFNCLFDNIASGGETCTTAGVLGMLTSIISSIQCTEALKILIGDENVRKTLLAIDIWTNDFDELQVDKNPNCIVCGREEYMFYGKAHDTQTASLCGRDAVQVVPAVPADIDLEAFEKRWIESEGTGTVTNKRFYLELEAGPYSIKLFKDGRAIVSGTPDINKARAVYTEYIGM